MGTCKCLAAGATILLTQRRFKHETYAHSPRTICCEKPQQRTILRRRKKENENTKHTTIYVV